MRRRRFPPLPGRAEPAASGRLLRLVLATAGVLWLALGERPARAQAEAEAAPDVLPLFDDGALRWSIEAGSEVAVSTRDGRTQKLDLRLEPRVELEVGEALWTLAARARLEPVDDIEPGRPEQRNESRLSRRLLLGDTAELELRELHVALDLGPAYVTAGKQFIVWGKSDGLKVLDLVNPQSFREFILPGFEDSRTSLWSVQAEIPLDDLLLELVWIPDPTYHEIPERGARFAFTSPLLVPIVPPGATLRSERRPRRIVRDSDIGFRLSTFVAGWDLSLSYLYHYDDQLVFPRTGPADGSVPIAIEPGYRRTHLLGVSGSTAFGDLVVRGEAAVRDRRLFTTRDARDPDGVVESSELSAVLGLDWSYFRSTLISVQLFQSHLANDSSGLVRDRTESLVTLLVRRTFMNDRLRAELIWLRGLNRSNGVLRPRLRYTVDDALEVYVGADVFHGDEDGIFGQFDESDRIYLGFEWTL